MDEKKLVEALSAYTDNLTRSSDAPLPPALTDEERKELTPLFRLSQRLQQNMQLVHPSPSFVHSLRDELVKESRRRIALRERIRRIVMIGAAALGSILSIVSVVGGIVLLVKWLRARSSTPRAPTTGHAPVS